MQLYMVFTNLEFTIYVAADSYAEAEEVFISKYRQNYEIESIKHLGPVLMRRKDG